MLNRLDHGWAHEDEGRGGEPITLPTVDRLDDFPELPVIGFEDRGSKDQDIDNDVQNAQW